MQTAKTTGRPLKVAEPQPAASVGATTLSAPVEAAATSTPKTAPGEPTPSCSTPASRPSSTRPGPLTSLGRCGWDGLGSYSASSAQAVSSFFQS